MLRARETGLHGECHKWHMEACTGAQLAREGQTVMSAAGSPKHTYSPLAEEQAAVSQTEVG